MPRVILGVKLYNTKEMAELLGVTTGTVQKYIREKKIIVRLIGGRHYASEEDLRNFLTGGE
jgi:excisionase family DNA binding protein